MPLTDIEIRKAKPSSKLVKMTDGGGLQLWHFPDGAKRWRFAYRFDNKQKLLAIGVYPGVSLQQARTAREAARRQLSDGLDPLLAKKSAKRAVFEASKNTFDAIADEFIQLKRREAKASRTIKKIEWLISLTRPHIGTRPITDIKAAEVLKILRSFEAKGQLETASRLRGTIGQIFRYAVASGRAEVDPTGALKGAIAAPVVTHRPAITDPAEFGVLLRAIDRYSGWPETRYALQLIALTFARPGEITTMKWDEVDFGSAVWTVPAHKMKGRKPHKVPLSPGAITVLNQLKKLGNKSIYVFPGARSPEKCMSENTLNNAIRGLGYSNQQMCAHGFRSAASTMLNECALWNPDAIEKQLAHVDKNKIRRVYHRAEYWDERIKIMNWWAEHCNYLRSGGQIIPFSKAPNRDEA